MGFNLTTFLAQIVNLFLLIWFLKRFLYRPVLAVIEKRRQQIIHQMQEAEKKLIQAEQTQNSVEKLKEDFEQQRQKRFSELEQEIQQQRAQMLKELDHDFRMKRDKLQADLDLNWAIAQDNIHQMIGKEFMTLAHKILTEWSDRTPMEQVLALFAKKLNLLSSSKRLQVQKLIHTQKSIQIITSAKLTQKQQNTLRQLLQSHFSLPPKIRLQYQQKSDLLLGLEIRIGNFSLDWNLNTYLDEINQHLKQEISSMIEPVKRKADK